MRNVLALDQAPRRIGFAIGGPDMTAPLSGSHPLPFAGARHGVMLCAARDWLETMVKTYRVSKLCFETPFAGKNVRSYALSNKLIGVVELVCGDQEIECVEVSPPEWRKRFIGCTQAPRIIPKTQRRNWLKEQAMRACAARNWTVDDNDAAEACGILEYVLALDHPDFGATSGAPLLAGGVA